MPNHVTTILTVEDSAILDSIQGVLDTEKGQKVLAIDFNKIIQKPKCVFDSNVRGDFSDLAKFISCPADNKTYMTDFYMERLSLLECSDEDFETFIKMMRSYRECGHTDWHSWNCEHWGTKWPAYSTSRVNAKTITFQTAWSIPLPIFKALSLGHPKTMISVIYADEDVGNNTGELEFLGGEIVKENIPDGASAAAYQIAASVLYPEGLPDFYKWDFDGKLEYIEENDN